MKSPSPTLARVSGLTVMLAGLMAFASITIASCSIPDSGRVTTVGGTTGPNEDLYKQYVDPYLARRCATLDCHGQIGRPLRLYSQLGLRQSDGGSYTPLEVSGFTGEPTTDAEKSANYEALVALQPEVMAQVVAGYPNDYSERLLLLLKPLNYIPHKGGKIIEPGGPEDTDPATQGYDCLHDWLGGGVLVTDPTTGTGTIDPVFVNACAGAASAP